MSSRFDDLWLEPGGGGQRIRVRVSPGARKEGVLGLYGDVLKVAVRAPPEKGRANKALVEVLAQALGVARSSLAVVAGETSRDKTLVVSGLEAATIRARLAAGSA
ncbi:MAG: DUF167 domain-containing protein [Candidatus Binatia bacterium]|nr:DUF167 domain-containing protein [Candidatus Binatia bacterium]